MSSVAHIIRQRRNRRERNRQKQHTRRIQALTLVGFFSVFLLIPLISGTVIAAVYYLQLTAELPQPESTIYLDPAVGASQIYDRSGQTLLWSVVDPLGDDRSWVSLDRLPPYLATATLLREDPDYLQTHDFNPYSTLQRLVTNYFNGPLPPDASLTGRLVRNVLAPPPDNITREYRAREYALVAEVNRLYSAQDILEWHLNTNYYGHDAYGIDAAAQVYFAKRAAELTLDEAALLVAIPTAPQYNPIDDLLAARGRQQEVLRDLLLVNAITENEYNIAQGMTTTIQSNISQAPIVAPEYVQYARRQAEILLDSLNYDGSRLVSRGGLQITTALDLTLQEQIDCTVQSHLARLSGGLGASSDQCAGVSYLPNVPVANGALPNMGAVTVIDARNGELIAAIGDITSPTRQPGPLLKPFVYFQGFSKGLYTPATMLLDIPQRFPGIAEGLIYTPTNADNRFLGPISLRRAMGAGLLPPAAQVANAEGLDSILRNARLIGLSNLSSDNFDLSLLERGGGVSLLDATYAYSVFATLGEMRGVDLGDGGRGARPRHPVAVLRIEDALGNVLWDYNDDSAPPKVTAILEPGLGYLVNNVLADNTTRTPILGTGNVFETSRPTAVVYGFAGGQNDAWTVGYTPNMVVGVWVGRSDDANMTLNATRQDAAAPIWRAITDLVHNRYGLGAEDWERPTNIVEARVCERSGLRPNGACPERVEIFLENTQPPEEDRFWQVVTVNNQTGQLATANTPAALREDRVFFIPPDDAADWWEANQLPVPPEAYDTVTRPELVQSTVISQPDLLDYVQGVVDVRGRVDAANLQYYQLAYGQGLNPTEWIDISGQQIEYTPGESLGLWDTTGLDGLYNLRLTAILNDNSLDPFVVQVTVDNVAPAIVLQAGEPGQVFSFLTDDSIPLEAIVEDNIRIDRVEFYVDDVLVGEDDTFPYGYEQPIETQGEIRFSAIVFDAAGNQADAELTVDVQRGGT